MKLSCLLFICLTSILLKASGYVLLSSEKFVLPFLLGGLLAFGLVYLQNRRNVTVTPQSRCNGGYTLYPGPGRSFCFRITADCRSWDDAQTACRMEGGNLAVLDDESLIPFVRGLTPFLLTASNCPPEQFAFLGATIDDMAVARFANGRIIPKDSPIWLPRLPDLPNNCVGAGLFEDDNNIASLLGRDCTLPSRYVCQQV